MTAQSNKTVPLSLTYCQDNQSHVQVQVSDSTEHGLLIWLAGVGSTQAWIDAFQSFLSLKHLLKYRTSLFLALTILIGLD